MIQRFGSAGLLFCVLLAGGARAQAQTDGAALAVVIGNSAYTGMPKLPACEMSANLAAASLTRAGFQVSLLANPSNARMGTAIATLGDAAAAAPTRAVIYYCGYVASYADRLFLLPADAHLERDTDVLTQGIVARLAMASVAMDTVTAGLVMMDAAVKPGDHDPPFGSMSRPATDTHAALAAIQLPGAGDLGPAPLASKLAELLRSGSVNLEKAGADLASQPGLARLHILVDRPATGSAWLVGGPAPAIASPGPASSVALAIPPSTAPAQAVPAIASATPVPTLNAADRRMLQLALQRLGYFKNRIDGNFGPETTIAIHRFQVDSNEVANGTLTAKQAERLLGR